MKKTFYITLVLLLILASLPLQKAVAQDNEPDILESTLNELISNGEYPEDLNSELEKENLELINFDLVETQLELDLITDEDEHDASIQSNLHLDFNNVQGALEVNSVLEGESVTSSYTLDIVTVTEDLIEFSMTDQLTGEVFNYSSNELYPSAIVAVPIGAWITAAALKALAASAILIIAGLTYVLATHAISKIQNQKNRKYNHYRATLTNKKLYIGDGISRSGAISRGKSGRDVWSVSKNQAKEVAKGVNRNGQPIHEIDKDRKGKYYHWHPYKRSPKMHSFYGYPQ
ncbi:hypothetical protein [Shouchella miscanthi]|uniref:Bacterial toxin 24 domain-containing protein n=1 Tax=Shouchella miscanthi TaxID=2598861 RepID=A0ABU6NIX4_9BACI|nr:hypothetical protein [Shouchella miscanthi]